MYNNLFATLDSKTTVITVTRRLSNYLSSEYKRYQQLSNQETATTADIIPLGDWLKRCWSDYCESNKDNALLLLSSAHEQAIWQQIISRSEVGKRLLQFNATTELAKQAWQSAKQYRLPLDAVAFEQTEDAATWLSWAQQFIADCEQNKWLDTNSLPDKLVALLQQHKINYQHKFVLIGFDELNPQYQLLFDQFAANGCTVTVFGPATITPHIMGLKLNDTTHEIEQMALWAKQLLRQQPQKTIGCIVPNLNEIRTDIISCFNEILAPTTHLPGHSPAAPFNLSDYYILSQYPIVRAALNLLHLYRPLEFNKVSALLRSPYVGQAEQEICARAKLDVQLRQHAETFISARELLVFAKKYQCTGLADLLSHYLTTMPDEHSKLYPSEWAALFEQQLTVLGWPGERPLNSNEYQIVERWQELLKEFSQLDIVLHKISLNTAISHLQQITSHTLYQPQSTPANIQVLTPLEAAGLQFDYLWIMGLHDNAWPPAANANPFLPISLQRQFKLPHASSEQELSFYKRLTQQLLQSANEIILSCPQLDGERSLRPSALFNAITDFTQDHLNLADHITLAEFIRRHSTLENYVDHSAPALQGTEKIIGGSAIFKYQALCPFRAFAQFRLGAQRLAAPHEGLDARERGSILHRALEFIWRQLQDHKTLLAKTETELYTLIQHAIEATLLDFTKQRPHIFKARFTEIEKTRLHKTLTAWLALEKQRPAFTVHAIEETYETQIASIPIKIRIDRIDRLADGDYIIFDYKTGLSSIKYWFSDRPDDPQLPLYISTSQLPINGLAFAVIRSNKMQFVGLSANDAEIDGIKHIDKVAADLLCNDWPTLIKQWQRVLTQLADEFTNGKAHCDPKNGEQTCRLCDLQTLCRIAEQS